MLIIILILAIIFVISLVLGRKAQDRIVSDLSPFSFAEDMLIVNTGTSFSVQGSNIECVELQFNPKALQNRFYDMSIHIVKTDGSRKNIRYRGSSNGAQPQDMADALRAHHIKCVLKD